MSEYKVETVMSADSDEETKNDVEGSPIAPGVLMEEVKESNKRSNSESGNYEAVIPERTASWEESKSEEGRTSVAAAGGVNPYHRSPEWKKGSRVNKVTPQKDGPSRNLRAGSKADRDESVLEDSAPEQAAPKRKRKDPPGGDRTERAGLQGNIPIDEKEQRNRIPPVQVNPKKPEKGQLKNDTEEAKQESKQGAGKNGPIVIPLATEYKCEKCNAHQRLTHCRMFAECGVCQHKNEDKYGDNIWRPCEDEIGHFTIPQNTKVQRETMVVVKDMIRDLDETIKEGNKIKPKDFEKMWTIRDACIEGNLLLRDCNQKVSSNVGLQDELANCQTALMCEDRVGFRKSFLSFMYYMLVGYHHTAKN